MNRASDTPANGPRNVTPAGARRVTLRAKGTLLFSFVSLYVVGAASLLIVQAMQLIEQRQDLVGSLEPLIWVAVVVGLLGLAIFGAFLTHFLSRLASDLGQLQTRALEVANGFRGAALDIGRDDEVGLLANAVNKMASDLDAREREISSARLEQFHSERMTLLGGIAAGVAHELGNPVAGIAAIADELVDAARHGRPIEIDAEMLRGLAERVAEITRRLALTAGIRSKEHAPVALNPVLESISALLRFDHRFKPIELATDFDPALPLIRAAEDDIVQLLLHLLVNAAEALQGSGQDSPRIVVTTRRNGAWAELHVQDNGHGMDEHTLARAFEPLFTTKPAGEGNGLGLDACRGIVERCGGEILLDSQCGKGTCVLCRFPVIGLVDAAAL